MKRIFTKSISRQTSLLLCFSLFMVQMLSAQIQVRGRVSEATGPLVGVTVLEKGQSNGTVSDVDGNFTINLRDTDAVLVFNYTGYATQEIALEGRTQLEVVLGEDATLLDQVVVVGYGTQKKSDLTGSVGSIQGQKLRSVATVDVAQSLQGKLAGVYVSPGSGEPGADAVIRIRGTGTLNNADPIFVIDGMITYDASLVNPQDVASVEVLKDASACAIYGARGSNGVIIITTKSGSKDGKAAISFNSYYGTQEVTKQLDLMNAAQFAQSYNELTNTQYFSDPAALGEGTNWQDEIFRTAPISNVQLGISGGSERYTYNISGNYFNQSGILKNDELQRVTVRLNNEFQVNDWLRLGNNLSYSNTKRDIAPSGVIGSAYRVSPTISPRDSAGNFSDPTVPFGLAIANPAADLYYRSNDHRNNDRFFGTVYGEIGLFKYFKFRSNFGFDIDNERGKTFVPIYTVSASQLTKDDQLTVRRNQKRDWIWEQTLTFDRSWGDNHHLTVLGGYTAENRGFETLEAGRRNFPGTLDDLLYLTAGNDTTQSNAQTARDEGLISYLFRTNYTLLNRYLFTVSARVDASSRFGEDNRTGVFPSFSLGWNAAQEQFIENMNIFDRLKLRFSYGILGNQNSIKDRYYPSLGIIRSGLYAVFGSEESLNQGATLVDYSNPGLRWESARQTDIGLEIGVLKNRLSAEIDWYDRLTYDIIAAVPIPDYVGSGSAPLVNTAKVRNTGWDITLNWRQAGRFAWNVGAILSPVHNEIVALNDQRSEIFAGALQGEFVTHSVTGSQIGEFYGYKTNGVFQSAEEAQASPRLENEGAGDLRFVDLNGDGKIDGTDRTDLGSPIPTLTYGFNAGFEFLGFDFSADLLGVTGNKIFNAKKLSRFSVYNWEASVFDGRWTPENPTATKPRITNGGHNYRVSDYYIEDGSFIRLRNVVLGYTLPLRWTQRAQINRLRVYVGGTNLWTKQKYSGYSPEFSNADNPFEVGLDYISYPVAKTWQIGLEASF